MLMLHGAKREGAGRAFVVGDHFGKILIPSSSSFGCNSAFAAEVQALEGASGYAAICDCRKIKWVSDALNVVQEVSSSLGP